LENSQDATPEEFLELHPQATDIMTAKAKVILANELAASGVLFWRKLGLIGDKADEHMKFLHDLWQKEDKLTGGPPKQSVSRLFPYSPHGLELALVSWNFLLA